MFTLSDVRIAINKIGFISVSKFSFDITSSPQTHQNLKGEIIAYSFGDGLKGSIKMTVDTDICQQFFSRMWNVELTLLLQSKLSTEGTSWLNSIIQKSPLHSANFSDFEFRCFLSGFGESLETKAGIRETEIQLDILGFKIDQEDFICRSKIAQFKEDTSQLEIDGEGFMPGVLVELSYDNSVIHEKKEIESSNVSFRIIKGYDEGKISGKALIFNTEKKLKELILKDFNDFFFKQEQDKEGKTRPKVRFIKHPCLFHHYFLIEKVGWSLKKDYIEISFNLLEFQAIQRDKIAPSSNSTIPPATGGGLEVKEIAPSGRVEKEVDSLIFTQELVKNKGNLRKTATEILF